jgi:hypothetical protein
MRGCEVFFKTVGGLDEHLKSKHSVPQKIKGYTCIQCDLTFNEQFQLRQHMTKKHVVRIEPKEISCEYCSHTFLSNVLLKEHQKECNTDFQPIKRQVCRYFLNGACVKGDFCRFAHPETRNDIQRAPFCRNGPRCRYLAQGVCCFFHKGVGVQIEKTQNGQGGQQWNDEGQQPAGRWCKYLEDCNRVPNCPFIHAEEDFPSLTNTNNPPLPKNIPGWWEDY